ncbi:MAG: alpha/beta hydrolase [Chloroflexi bacterium]|nr:alpha/beta hydrolase [Chloroflexota bacterium]
MPSVNVNGESIYYEGNGGSSALPVVFVHGAGGTGARWLPVAQALTNCVTYAIDLPAHGQSTGEGRDTVGAYAEVVVGFLNSLNLPSAIIAGHSLGGGIALWMALQQPARVRGLALVGTGARLRVHPQILNAVKAGRPIPANPAADTTPEPPADMAPVNPVPYWDWVACNRFDVMGRLGEIHLPTLVIVGTKDMNTPVKFATYLRDNIAGAQMAIIEDAGHSAMADKPAEVLAAMQPFVDSFK